MDEPLPTLVELSGSLILMSNFEPVTVMLAALPTFISGVKTSDAPGLMV